MAPRKPSKYEPFARYLRAQSSDSVRVSFSDIERIIGAKLPRSADTHRAYWSNNASNSVLTRAWLAAGFRSEHVDLAGRRLVFRRAEAARASQTLGSDADASSQEHAALFGCMAGTIVVNADLTEPPDQKLAEYLDGAYNPEA